MKKTEYAQKAVLMKTDVHRVLQACARYFGCTQSELIDLLLHVAKLTDDNNVKSKSLRMMEEHLDHYYKNKVRKPGLQEFLNAIEENK